MSAKLLLMSFAVLCLATTVLADCTIPDKCDDNDLGVFVTVVSELVECQKMKNETDEDAKKIKDCQDKHMMGMMATDAIVQMTANGCGPKDLTGEAKKCCDKFEPLLTECMTSATECIVGKFKTVKEYREAKEDEAEAAE